MRGEVIGVLFLFVSLIGFQSLNAQSSGTGALTGTIKDPSGAVVPSASVTLTSADTGAVRTTMTAADGTYRFSLLPPGNYRVKIECELAGRARMISKTRKALGSVVFATVKAVLFDLLLALWCHCNPMLESRLPMQITVLNDFAHFQEPCAIRWRGFHVVGLIHALYLSIPRRMVTTKSQACCDR